MTELILTQRDIRILFEKATDIWFFLDVPRDWIFQMTGYHVNKRNTAPEKYLVMEHYIEFETDQDMVEFKLKWL